MTVSRLPAVAVAVILPGGEVRTAADSRKGAVVTPDTPFLLGSVTKTFTALAVAQLADAGRLRFDDPVSRHLPGFALSGSDSGRSITLRHLLTHTSGVTQWSGHDRRAQREGRFEHIEPARAPGESFEYSSLNYMILGKVVEAVSGMTYGEYVRRHIFEPLEMRNSYARLADAQAKGLIQGHWFLFGLSIRGRETQQPETLVPAGFLIASARDLGNYVSMLLNDGRFGERQIVSSESLREMFTPWGNATSGPGMAWGIGSRTIGHAGSTPTFSARISLLREERAGIVVLTNVNSGPFLAGAAAVLDGVTRLVRGEQVSPARPDEILLKLGLLVLVTAGVVRMLAALRKWWRLGFPRRLTASRRIVTSLAVEGVAALVVLIGIPRWIGVPLLTILEYFPDLGLAMAAGVMTGVSGALIRALVPGTTVAPTA